MVSLRASNRENSLLASDTREGHTEEIREEQGERQESRYGEIYGERKRDGGKKEKKLSELNSLKYIMVSLSYQGI